MTLEERDKLIKLFEKYGNLLPQSQKQSLHLYLYEDLSLREIADEVASSRQAVHDAITKGTKKLFKIDATI